MRCSTIANFRLDSLVKKEPSDYAEWREETERRFDSLTVLAGQDEHHVSPSGRFTLDISEYGAGDGSWNYSRGIAKAVETGKVIADVKRNYGDFWHCWVKQKEDEFLLCGEDYQGYNVIDLNTCANAFTFPEEAFKGMGFCWAAVYPSPDGTVLAVEGCYWACPYELVFIDFSDPMKSPLPLLQRYAQLDVIEGWTDNLGFRFTAYDNEDENPPSRPVVWARGAEAKR